MVMKHTGQSSFVVITHSTTTYKIDIILKNYKYYSETINSQRTSSSLVLGDSLLISVLIPWVTF